MTAELLPCPFCGKTPTIVYTPEDGFGVHGASVHIACCNGIFIRHGATKWIRNKGHIDIRAEAEEAVRTWWNTRT